MVRYAASFTVHTPSTPSTRINITPVARREEAIQRGLKRRLEQLSEERERRARAAAAADEDFSAEFLTMARQVFDMIDVDESGYLDKDEIIDAVPTCVEINQCVGCTRQFGRAARNRHRHVVEQASRRWRGGGEAPRQLIYALWQPIIIKTAGLDASPIERWQIRMPLSAVTCANF